MTQAAPHVDLSVAPAQSIGYRHTLWFLFAFYLLAVVWGVRNVHYWERSILDLLVPIAFNICTAFWALVDARRRGRPIPMFAQWIFLLFAGIVVPGYVIWTRGWRGLGWLALHALLSYTVVAVTMFAVGVGMYGEEWLRALDR